MTIRDILLLGNPKLYEVSQAVKETDLEALPHVIADLHDTLLEFRRKYGAGRAVAACQIGFAKRLIYMFIDQPVVFINPSLENKSEEMIQVWDDCMCFPDLLVKVMRHKSCTVRFRDLGFKEHSMKIGDDLSELLQHEYDHLDGILAVSRAVDGHSFALKSQKPYLNRTAHGSRVTGHGQTVKKSF